ncbi:MAG TPA: hypothetical protein VLH94_01250 [Spirochaetia bacterium]|nr:hypothetical protein [Spirochaetia bacterium]
MSNSLDRKTSKVVFDKMRRENRSNADILMVLQEINHEATDDEIILFLAECIGAVKIVPVTLKNRMEMPDFGSRSTPSSSSCAGSSSRAC